MTQAQSTTMYGQTVYRWFILTPTGRRVTWAPTEEAARERAERQGCEVVRIEPAPPVTPAELQRTP